jgi:hypothetical protein
MLIKNLFQTALVEPCVSGANEIFIVSGYASATFANRHLKIIKDAKVNLVIGMPGKRSDHLGYLDLITEYPGRFNGYYLESSPPVHTKMYGWFKNEKPIIGFAGSANYSQPGFIDLFQINQLSNDNPNEIRDFFYSVLGRAKKIQDVTVPNIKEVVATDTELFLPKGSIRPGEILWEIPNKRVRISFLSRDGLLPQKSGLNWGQRPEYKREPNQAYLSIRKSARNPGFLPPIGNTFTLITDDSIAIDCVVAQEGRKAIHSTKNNSELGKYIKNRIGVPLGNPVSRDDLERYGRTDFTIQKINDETFLLDLSVSLC